jgi:aminoglycoside phosphotransferase (APT) family kinase protein
MSQAGSDDGRTLLAQGREAEVFLQPDGSVLKLMRRPEWNHLVEREATALRAVRGHGVGAPEVLGTAMVDGRAGLVMERLPGTDLFGILSRNPLLIFRVANVMGAVHARMHDVEAPTSLPDLHDDLRRRIDRAADLPAHLARIALAQLDGLPRGDRLCHGDFHPGNILGPWNQPAIIDWGNATRGNPVADVARTDLLQWLGEPPPGTSLFIRTVAPVGGRLMSRLYRGQYRRHRPVDPDSLRRWEIVWAAARVAEQIEAEYRALLSFLERATRRLA